MGSKNFVVLLYFESGGIKGFSERGSPMDKVPIWKEDAFHRVLKSSTTFGSRLGTHSHCPEHSAKVPLTHTPTLLIFLACDCGSVFLHHEQDRAWHPGLISVPSIAMTTELCLHFNN